MKDFKILWLGKNDIYKMASWGMYFREALSEIAEVSTYGVGWPHPDLPTGGKPWHSKEPDLLKLVKVFDPDFIYIDLYFNWVNLPKIDVPVSIFWSDPHDRIDRYLAWVKENKPDVCLLPYWGDYPRWGMQRLKEHLPDVRLLHFPMSVNVDVFKDYGYERDIDLCLLGRVSRRWLPLRTTIINHYKDSKDYKVFYRQRPKRNWNWDEAALKKHDFVARESFAKLLARCKMWPFGLGITRYPLIKLFEGMASKTLVLSDSPVEAEKIHITPDKDYVEINLDNYEEKIDYYLENESERKKIIESGYKTVHKYHTTRIRARELIDYVENELL